MKYIKLFENFDEMTIEEELNFYNIRNYKINKDGTIDVDGMVKLRNKNLTKIPFKFGKVSGTFDCSGNNITSLEGSPYYVGNNFDCSDNKLSNLIGGPEEVDDGYFCYHNKLTSLEGIAAEIGGKLSCWCNKLIDLDISSVIKGDIDCHANYGIGSNNYNFYGEVGGKIIFTN